MKKIFACDQFAADENKSFSFTSTTSKKYLETMLSCIDGDELCIAKKEDDISINLAENFSVADFVVKYTFDLSKIDVATVVAKEQTLFAACREIAGKKEGKKKTRGAVQTVVGENTDTQGIRVMNVVNRAQRLEKLLELGAPDFVVANERLYLIEELALNAFAVKRGVIERDDFLQAPGI